MKKLSRQQTAAEVKRIISMLPSKELIVSTFVSFHLAGLQPGDCRFCVKGAVETFYGDIRLVRNEQGVYRTHAWSDEQPTYTILDFTTLHEIESALFRTKNAGYLSESIPDHRRRLFDAALAKCDEIIAE